MYEIVKTDEFDTWLTRLRDKKARQIILDHVNRMSVGNLGVTRQVGGDVYEKKINYAGGYRLYYFMRWHQYIIMLLGGTKRTQRHDIEKAIALRKEIYDGETE